ncbi:MAG: M12 family metallopeptidase, partial [Verrucomicrobium sp.]
GAGDADFIRVVRGAKPNVGSSPVGRQGGTQLLTLGDNCGYGVTLHELCHAIGLFHEQSRSDRDNYVCILWDNIEDSPDDMSYNFNKRPHDGIDLGGYDFESIMHYFPTAFSKNGKPTLMAKKSGVKFGQQTHLSGGDIAAIRSLYP